MLTGEKVDFEVIMSLIITPDWRLHQQDEQCWGEVGHLSCLDRSGTRLQSGKAGGRRTIFTRAKKNKEEWTLRICQGTGLIHHRWLLYGDLISRRGSQQPPPKLLIGCLSTQRGI